jgi:hypothetical protein
MITLIAAFVLNHLAASTVPKLRMLARICLLITTLELVISQINYHPVVKLEEFLQLPSLASDLNREDRYYSFLPFQVEAWNRVYDQQGWSDINPYLYFKNGLDPNTNLLWQLSSVTDYSGMRPERMDIYKAILNTSLLSAAAGKNIISTRPFSDQPDFTLITQLPKPNDQLPDYYLYANTAALDRFRLISQYQVKPGFMEAAKSVYQQSYPFATTDILETDIGEQFPPLTVKQINVITNSHQLVNLQTTTDQPALLTVADSYYPGWHAYVDGRETKIYPANINQRAIILPAGEHRVTFRYLSTYFYLGLILAGLGYLLIPILYKLLPKLWSTYAD